MVGTNILTKEQVDKEENPFSFRDFISYIKVTRDNEKTIHVSPSVKRKFDKYLKANGARTQSHAVNMLVEENKILRQICGKLDIAIKRAYRENNINFLIRIFAELATENEKSYYDAILLGYFD